MWKNLPIESKRFYKIQGMGNVKRPKRISGFFVRKVLNSGAVRPDPFASIHQSDYSWMDHQMNWW